MPWLGQHWHSTRQPSVSGGKKEGMQSDVYSTCRFIFSFFSFILFSFSRLRVVDELLITPHQLNPISTHLISTPHPSSPRGWTVRSLAFPVDAGILSLMFAIFSDSMQSGEYVTNMNILPFFDLRLVTVAHAVRLSDLKSSFCYFISSLAHHFARIAPISLNLALYLLPPSGIFGPTKVVSQLF